MVSPKAVRKGTVLRSSAFLLGLSLMSPPPGWAAPQDDSASAAEETAAPVDSADSEGTSVSEVPSTSANDHEVTLEAISTRADSIQKRLEALEQRVLLLRETVATGKVAPTQALIVHRNQMGSSFRLEEVLYTLDDREILSKTDKEGFLDAQREFEVLNGSLPAGEHEIKVSMTFGGSGFGLFTYLKGYRFKVESRYRFVVAEGRLTRLSVVAHEKADITLEPKDRLAVRYDLEVGSVPSATGR